MTDPSKRIALVTGASRGIGYHTALSLAARDHHVIAIARTVGGLEELDDAIQEAGGSATLVPLDLREHDAIDQLGASLHERWGSLDALVANAGMLGGLSPLDHVDPADWDKIFSLNVTANYRLIRSLAPLLRASAAPRAVFITCEAAVQSRPFWGAYSASKAALEAMVNSFAQENEKSGLKVNLCDPGATRTALRAQAMPGENPDTLAHPSEVADFIADLCLPDESRTQMRLVRPA